MLRSASLIAGLFAAIVAAAVIGCDSLIEVERSPSGREENPDACPATEVQLYLGCPEESLECRYEYGSELDCYTIYECARPDGINRTWVRSYAWCGGVACQYAHEGEPCGYLGESCSSGDECGGTEAVCGENHEWEVLYYDDECCGVDAPPCAGG